MSPSDPCSATTTKDSGYIGDRAAIASATAARATRGAGLPLVAIGGITLEHAPRVIEAGAASVAVIGDLLATGDPEARVRDESGGSGEAAEDTERISHRDTETQRTSVSLCSLWLLILCELVRLCELAGGNV